MTRERARWEHSIRYFRLETVLAFWPIRAPGPVNFIDVHPRVQMELPHAVSVSTDLVVQWRENIHDGVYAVPGFLLVPANGSRARFVGYRPGIEVRWQIGRHAYLQADYGVFYAGQFLKEASPGRNINYIEF